jgi:hypothetical protein
MKGRGGGWDEDQEATNRRKRQKGEKDKEE